MAPPVLFVGSASNSRFDLDRHSRSDHDRQFRDHSNDTEAEPRRTLGSGVGERRHSTPKPVQTPRALCRPPLRREHARLFLLNAE
jgi:hypothetical protein